MADASKILLTEGDAPATPAAGIAATYAKTDHKLYTKGSDGVEHGVAADITTDGAWVAKGDLIVGTGENTAAILTAGTNGKYLKAASGEATGLIWDTPAGSGAVATDAIWDAKGDLAVGTGADTAAKLTIGSEDDVLMVQSGTPAWVASAVGAEIAGVVTAGAGTGNTFSRGDHVHAINHAITDNHLLTVDGTLEDNDFAYATANGIEGKTAAESLTLLLAATMAESDTLKLASKSSLHIPTLATTLTDGHWEGITVAGVIGTAAGQIFGALCYFNPATNEWLLCDADAAATAKGTLGICLDAGAENDASTYLLWGRVRADAAFPALTALTTTYMSGTAGEITETAPTGSSGIIRVLGYSVNANEIFFQPSTDYYTLA